METKVLLTGGSGRLGRWVLPELKKSGFSILSPSSSEMNVTEKESVKKTFEMFKPDIIIHLAAFTGIPPCENNKKNAWKTNVLGTQNIIEAAEENDSFIIYMSTPCVFSGDNEEEYSERSIPYPKNFYGLTKLAGEQLVIRSKGVIVRGNFVPYEKWPHPKAFTDRFSNYLFSNNIGEAFVDIINKHLREEKISKIIHIVGDKKISMYELAKLCPESSEVKPYTLEEYYSENPDAAKLTKNMSLLSNNWKSYELKVPK